MSKVYNKIFTLLILVSILFFAMCFVPSVANAKNHELSPAEEKCMWAAQVYRAHESDAKIDIYQFLDEANALDPKMYNCWKPIFDFWIAMNENKDFVNTQKVPEGLPNDNSLCIFCLGGGVNPETLEPTEEVKGRLSKAYETWAAHPNAYIGVSGGKTSTQKISEGESMYNYLIKTYSVPGDKIIVEDKAQNTQQNCALMYQILNEKYPSVDKVCMVTSDYHIRRGSVLWHAMTLAANLYPEVYNEGKPSRYIPYVANTAFDTHYKAVETIGGQGIAVERELFDPTFSVNAKGICPSVLDSLALKSEARCFVGDTYKPNISALFVRDDDKLEDVPWKLAENIEVGSFVPKNQSNEKLVQFNKDVSQICSIECDTSTVGVHKCSVSYAYMGKTKNLDFDVEVVDKENPPTPTPASDSAQVNATPQTSDDCLCLIVALILTAAISACAISKKATDIR